MKTVKDDLTIEDFDERFLRGMFDQRPDVFNNFLIKNQSEVLARMGLVFVVEESLVEEKTAMAVQKKAFSQSIDKCLEATERWANIPKYEKDFTNMEHFNSAKAKNLGKESLCDNSAVLDDCDKSESKDKTPPLHIQCKTLKILSKKLNLAKENVIKIVPASIPNDWLPFGLEDFGTLDSQTGVDEPKNQCAIVKPCILTPRDFKDNRVFGWQNGSWSEKVADDIPLTVETSEGETSTSWCQMTW